MPSPLPPGSQPQRGGPKRTMGRREKGIVALLGAVTLVVVILTVVSIASTNHTKKGCLDAIVPGPIGSTFFKQCGSAARSICANLQQSNDLNDTGIAIVATDCRRAGYPVK